MKMTEESTTDVLNKYIKLKEEYDAAKVKMGVLEKANTDLAKSYETAKGEIVNLQGLVTKYVVSSEPDKTVDNKKKTIKDIFMDEFNKIEKD